MHIAAHCSVLFALNCNRKKVNDVENIGFVLQPEWQCVEFGA